MHVLAIYSVNEHLGDLMARRQRAARQRGEGRAAKTSRFAFLTSRSPGGGSAAGRGPHEGLAG